jgi:DNA repair exonuclease SbcCD nuclease subunit
MFRFLHAADIHLDSPLRGLARYQGAPLDELQGATRRALTNLVTEAIALEVDFVLIAGDLYDGDWPDYNTGLFFVQEMSRLEQAGIPVITIAGNHDAQSKITKALRLPSNVTACSVNKPQTVLLKEHHVAIHGQGFSQRVVTEDLSKEYPSPLEGWFNIGLLHTSADGRPGHDPYAPCSVEFLRNFGYQYWALGHVHQREVLCAAPWIVFSGNLQGRHARELGPKGATLVTVNEGAVQSVEEVFLDVVRWGHLKIDISDIRDGHQFLDLVLDRLREEKRAAGARLLAYRVETQGRGPFHSQLSSGLERWTNELRNLSNQLGGHAWFEKLVMSSGNLPSTVEADESLSHLLNGIRSRAQDPATLQSLSEELFEGLLRKLPRAWRVGEVKFDPTDPEYLTSVLGDVVGLLEERLSKLEGDAP